MGIILSIILTIVFPFTPFIFCMILVAACYAPFLATRSFFVALVDNINPYVTYVDSHPNVAYGRRRYFFGPGFHQIVTTVSAAFRLSGKKYSVFLLIRSPLRHHKDSTASRYPS